MLLSGITKVDPEQLLFRKAQRLEHSLYASGGLANVTLLIADLEQGLQSRIEKEVKKTMESRECLFIEWHVSGDYTISALCRPEVLALAQAEFCCLTNRIRSGKLRWIGGNREDVECHLPDGLIVDLDQCHKWLNESIAEGWLVGVASVSYNPGKTVISATRKRPPAKESLPPQSRSIQGPRSFPGTTAAPNGL